jgi:hypothetical protein
MKCVHSPELVFPKQTFTNFTTKGILEENVLVKKNLRPNLRKNIWYEVLTKHVLACDVLPCRLEEAYRRFGGNYFFHLQ